MHLKNMFEVGMMYGGTQLRTPMIYPVLVDDYLGMKEKELLLVEQPNEFLIES
jgi:hypothetical protein